MDGKLLLHPNGQMMEENERRNMELACKLSHLRLIKYAKDKGYKNILIFEDDARLVDGFIDKLESIVQRVTNGKLFFFDGHFQTMEIVIKNAPFWQMLYLGVNHINPPVEIDGNLCRVITGFTTHAYAVNCTAYDLLLSALDYRGQADVLYADYIHPLGHSYAISPNIAYQEDGFSDITLKEESYKQLK